MTTASPGVDSTLAAVRELVLRCGLEFDESSVRLLINRTVRPGADSPELSRELWLEDLITVLGELGLQARRVRAEARRGPSLVERQAPALGLIPGTEEDRWAVLSDPGWGRVRVKESGAPPRRIGRWRFRGFDDVEDPVEWLLVQPVDFGTRSSVEDPGPTTPWRRFLQLLRPDRADVWVVVAFAVSIGIMSLATPIAVQIMVNFVAFGGVLQPVVILAILLFAGLGFAGLLRGLESYVVEILQRRIFVRVASDLAQRLPRVHARAADDAYGPERVNRFFDVMTVQKITSVLLLDGLYTILNTLIGLIVLAFYHPILLVFGILLLACMLVVVFVMGRGAVRTAILESKAKYRVAGWFEEVARLPVVFKHGGGAQHSIDRADHLTRDYLEYRKRHFRILFTQIVGAIFIQVIASVALLTIGGFLVIEGSLTLGQLVAAELIVTVVVASFSKIGKHLGDFYDLMAAMDKLGELFDIPLEKSDGETIVPAPGAGRLEIRNVLFAYPGGRPVLDGLSFDVAPGARTVVTGAHRAGKSTLLELLFGLREPEHGQFLLDGVDSRSFRLSSWRQQVALVSNADIFQGTVSENVRLGRSHVSMTAVREALERMDLLDELLELPEGLETLIGAGAFPLTESQVERLCLARAIAGSPRVLVVDNVFDHLGTTRRWKILDALFDENAPWTLIIVSERPDILERGDSIVHLEDGKARIESGVGPQTRSQS